MVPHVSRQLFLIACIGKVPLVNAKLLVFVQTFNVIPYDTRCYFNVRSKANTSQLNLPHGKCGTFAKLTGSSEPQTDKQM